MKLQEVLPSNLWPFATVAVTEPGTIQTIDPDQGLKLCETPLELIDQLEALCLDEGPLTDLLAGYRREYLRAGSATSGPEVIA